MLRMSDKELHDFHMFIIERNGDFDLAEKVRLSNFVSAWYKESQGVKSFKYSTVKEC